MNESAIVAVTRRGALRSFPGFVLTGWTAFMGRPLTAAADPARVGAGKRDQGDKRCKEQVGECRSEIRALCGGDPACLEALSCRDTLRVCKFDHFLTCLVTSGAS